MTGAEWQFKDENANDPDAHEDNLPDKLIDPLLNETLLSYDARKNISETTDALNRLSAASYNDLDLPATVTDAANNESSYSYRADGLWNSLTDHRGKNYTAAYLRSGQRQELVFPDAAKEERVYTTNNDLSSSWRGEMRGRSLIPGTIPAG